MRYRYQIVEYTEAMRAPVIKLLDDHLWRVGIEKSTQQFIHKYESNPYHFEPTGFVALQDQRVVGFRALYPTLWQIGDDRSRTLRMVSPTDTVVHPQHQRQGVFSALLRAGFSRLNMASCAAYVNLSANYKAKNGLLKFGWKQLSAITFARRFTLASILKYTWRVKLGLAKVVMPEGCGRSGRNEICQELKAAEMASLLSASDAHSEKFTLIKDENYLTYRYGSPLHRYCYVYDWGANALDGFISIRLVGKGRNAHLVDYAYTSIGVLERMLGFLTRQRCFDIFSIWSFGLSHEVRCVFSELGFNLNTPLSRMTNLDKNVQYCLVRPMVEHSSNEDWIVCGKNLSNINNWDFREFCADDS